MSGDVTVRIDWLRENLALIGDRCSRIEGKIDTLVDEIHTRDVAVEHRLTKTETKARTHAAVVSALVAALGGILTTLLGR